MTTKAPAVKAYLLTLYQGLSVVPSQQVDVTYSWPIGRPPEQRWASFGDVNWERSEWKTNRSREEAFTIAVTLSVQMNGATAREAEEFAALMATQFEAALRADPSLGGLAVTSGFQPRDLKSWPIKGAMEAQFQVEVSAVCRP